jgi:hypothetical protein
MSRTKSSASKTPQPPVLWKYALWALVALLILIPVWVLVVMLVIQPDVLTTQEQSMSNRLLWWVAMPLAIVVAVAGGRWALASNTATAENRRVATSMPTSQAAPTPVSPVEKSQREYVLEVVSLGITLDKYRQGALWDALRQGHPYASIREQDPKKYPWSADEKSGQEGGRIADTLENGAKYLPSYWGTASFYATSPILDPASQPSDIDPVSGMVGGNDSSGMGGTLFVVAPWALAERPDRLVERVFAFFDEHPDMPYVVLSAADGMEIRDMNALRGQPKGVKDGNYVPERPDASALLVLARRERVEAIRPFKFDDLDHKQSTVAEMNAKSYSRRLFLAYLNLCRKVPTTPDLRNVGRQPTVNEWLVAAKEFAQREDIYPKGFSLANGLNSFGVKGPPKEFKPTPWFPLPWNKQQFADWDALPTLGYLHRPVFVKTTDDKGKPLSRRDAREAALSAGWQQALLTLPEAERNRAPARVVAATGNNTDQTVALSGMLNRWAEQGGPQLDASKPAQWINTDARLGNTGAATWFVQMAIGVMGSYREGGVSAAINLRDPAEASIVLISPPSEDQRKRQQHPHGGDVFRHKVAPAVNPADYKN